MLLTGTFLDEITYDIPHQNWGRREWDRDFRAMRVMGIDTVILIRCGLGRFLTYPSTVLVEREKGYKPPLDLVDMFLTLSEKYGMAFYFGTYDSHHYWQAGDYENEVDVNLRVMDEVWDRYGGRRAFSGWYLCHEVSRKIGKIIETYARMGKHAKAISGNLPVLVSPYMDGVKAAFGGPDLRRPESVSPEQHREEWDEIMGGIRGAVDIVAAQDGHVDYHELADFIAVNRDLTRKHGLRCWTNTESFDRDMPIRFLPIHWEKMLLKLDAAQRAGVEKAITFEFSHFMSPYSCYLQARGLYRRYCEHFGLDYSCLQLPDFP